YPFVVEPQLPLAAQGWLWSAGYLLLVGLTAGCAWQLRRTEPGVRRQGPGVKGQEPRTPDPCLLTPDSCSWTDRLRWLGLAFVPSSLLLSVTQFITTDIAPVPGLWVLPLAVYLLTFIVAFGRTPRWVQHAVA